MSRNKGNYGKGPCAQFWKGYSIRDGHSQPGNPKASNEQGDGPKKPGLVKREQELASAKAAQREDVSNAITESGYLSTPASISRVNRASKPIIDQAEKNLKRQQDVK